MKKLINYCENPMNVFAIIVTFLVGLGVCVNVYTTSEYTTGINIVFYITSWIPFIGVMLNAYLTPLK